MALNSLSKGFLNNRDHPPPLWNISNIPFTDFPPRVTSPDQQPCDGTSAPSAMRSVLWDGYSFPSLFANGTKALLQIEFTIAPSSNNPLIFNGIPFLPFNSTVCTNGWTAVSEMFRLTVYRSTQILFGRSEGT